MNMKRTLTLCLIAGLFCFVFVLVSQIQGQETGPSFRYGGKKIQLSDFKKGKVQTSDHDQYKAEKSSLITPDGKLKLTIDRKIYKDFPVSEYSIRLTNLSKTESTDLVEDFQSLDFKVNLPKKGSTVFLNTITGSTNTAADFTPDVRSLPSGGKKTFKTTCGRSSNDYIPFIELNFGDSEGWIFAIGWTGSWNAEFSNDGSTVRVKFGMIATRFKLLPGESIIQPSMTVFHRSGLSRNAFKTTVHRFMVEQKAPRDAKGKIIPPIHAITVAGGNKTPQMMLAILQYVIDNKLPFDTLWIDAGWNGAPHETNPYTNCGPQWRTYLGDWRVNTTVHPTGDLLPIANAVHKAGMKFLLWFEPERSKPGATIRREHPEYWHGDFLELKIPNVHPEKMDLNRGKGDCLLDLGNPNALHWIQDVVYGMIQKHGIDVYRQDFNMDPGPVWAELDKKNPDRIGIAEVKHIAGMYTFLDEMRQRFPNIIQENCASGGRRIDIEMISRAHTYCRSDYPIGRKKTYDAAFIMSQNATLNTLAFLPFQGSESNCVTPFDDYGLMSAVSSGVVCTLSDLNGGIIKRKFTDEETTWFKKVYGTAWRMREFYMGNFYPLTEETADVDDCWCAWQCARSDQSAGFAIAFRRAIAPEQSKTFALSGIDRTAKYRLEFYNGESKTVNGSELANWSVKQNPRSVTLVFYEKVK